MNDAGAPLVSVVVPAYNVAGYLERALDSALTQTMTNLEILVVDDGSNDSTFEVACRVATRDSRVRVLRNERNLGIGASRNRGFGAARGGWIALLDGDDMWLPQRLERMLAVSDGADVVSDDVCVMRGSSTNDCEPVFWSYLQMRGFNLKKPRYLSLLDFAWYDLALTQPLIRRSFLEHYKLEYDPALRINEDFQFYLEILALKARWLQLPRGYYLYNTRRVGSVCSSPSLQSQDLIKATQSLFKHPGVVGDAALVAALERRIREARSVIAFESVRDVLRRHRFGDIARLLFEQPPYLTLSMSFVIKSLIRRMRIKRRSLSELEAEA